MAEVTLTAKQRKEKEKEERLERKAAYKAHEEMVQASHKRRREDRKKLTQKTKRGQPNLNNQMDLILAKLSK